MKGIKVSNDNYFINQGDPFRKRRIG